MELLLRDRPATTAAGEWARTTRRRCYGEVSPRPEDSHHQLPLRHASVAGSRMKSSLLVDWMPQLGCQQGPG